MKIKYVGRKPEQPDHLYGSNKIWVGLGDVQEVPDDIAPRLLSHPDMWAIADETVDVKPPPPDPARIVMFKLKENTGDGRVVLIDGESDDETDVTDYIDEDWKLFARTHGIQFGARLRGDALATEIITKATE